MATYNLNIDDEDDEFLDPSAFFGSSSGAFSLNSDIFEVENTVADAVGRQGIAWNPEVTAVGQHGSLSRIPLAAHDGFHDCKQFFHDYRFDTNNVDCTDVQLEDIQLHGGDEGSFSLFDEPVSSEDGQLEKELTEDVSVGGDGEGADMIGGSDLMSSVTNRVSNLFSSAADDTDLQMVSSSLSNQANNSQALLESLIRENQTVIRATNNRNRFSNAPGGNAMPTTRAARYVWRTASACFVGGH